MVRFTSMVNQSLNWHLTYSLCLHFNSKLSVRQLYPGSAEVMIIVHKLSFF